MAVSKKNTRVLVTMPRELREKLREMANKENRTLSNFVLTIIQKYLEELEKHPS